MRRLLVATAILMAIPGVASAGGGGVEGSGCLGSGFSEGTKVVMRDSCFAGTAHFAPNGASVTVSNEGQFPHTLTAVDGSFDTGTVGPGSSAQLAVDEPGIYRVYCTLHGTAQGDGMAGVLVVGDPAPTSAASPTDVRGSSDVVALGSDGNPASASPQVVTVPSQVDPVHLVVLLMVGLATGLGLSALLTVLRLKVADNSSSHPERLQPTEG